MRLARALPVAATALAAVAVGHAATRTYSSGPLALAIPAGGAAEHAIVVPDAGPVSHVGVGVRIDHPRDRDLTLSLTSPSGRTVTLISGQGDGANFGTGRGCGGAFTWFDDQFGDPQSSGSPPFAGSYLPAQPLRTFVGDEARGRWTLRIRDSGGGGAGTLRCWQLDLSRNVVTVQHAAAGGVVAELRFRESNGVFRDLRLRIARRGRVLLDAPVPHTGCAGLCPGWRPAGPPVVRDLDADREPEIVLAVYSGGAHCCTYSLIYRFTGRGYSLAAHGWGNPGYRLVDLDRDGRPELASSDDRFAYEFTAFAASLEPVQLWHYDRGRLVDVTRSFPASIRADAAYLWHLYLQERRRTPHDVRGILAAWLADELMLGRGADGWAALESAYRRGDLGRAGQDAWPAGSSYLKALRAFLHRTGYL